MSNVIPELKKKVQSDNFFLDIGYKMLRIQSMTYCKWNSLWSFHGE